MDSIWNFKTCDTVNFYWGSRSALSGCFADAAPDSWGRALMTRALGGGFSEFDYLVRSDDRTRQGALRFLDEGMEPLSDLTPPIPRLVELERIAHLRNSSNAILQQQRRKKKKKPATWLALPGPLVELVQKPMCRVMGICG